MNVSIIIPNYNGEAILKKNLPKVLEAVRGYREGRIEIIIPDDPSTDKSMDVITSFISKIKEKHVVGKTIKNIDKRKSGFSKNVNRGVTLATGEILILLNTDVAPHADFLLPLLERFTNPKVFAVGCMDESIENGTIVLRGRGIGKWEKGFLLHNLGTLDKDTTFWASGGSSAFRKSVWDTMGGLNELYNPYYWEDIDISYRARKAGYDICFEKKSVVIHEHGKGAILSQHQPFLVRKTAYRNQFFFVWLNITDKKLLFSHIFWLPYHILGALLRKDKAFLFGFFEAIIHLQPVLKSRKRTVCLFHKTDQAVLQDIAE